MSEIILSEDNKIISAVPNNQSWDNAKAELIGSCIVVRNGHEVHNIELGHNPVALAQAKEKSKLILTYFSIDTEKPQMSEIEIQH